MRRGRPRHNDILTPREWEVLALLGKGRSNPEIATELGISLNGAKYHVSEILQKLGVETREEAGRLYRTHRPKQPALLAALQALRRLLPVPLPIAANVAIVALIALLAFLALEGFGSGGSPLPEPEDTFSAGLDLPPEEQNGVTAQQPQVTLPHTLLLAHGTPTNTGSGAATIAAMQRVSSVAELVQELRDDIRVIAIDRSALDDVRNSSVLYDQLVAGRLLIGINLTNNELREVSQYNRFVTEIVKQRTGNTIPTLPVLREPSRLGEPSFSALLFNLPESSHETSAFPALEGAQRYFDEGEFEFLAVALDSETRVPQSNRAVDVNDLLPERASVNNGMGCGPYDSARVAAAAKRGILDARPNTQALGFMVIYCNPGDRPDQVILGALLSVPNADPAIKRCPPPSSGLCSTPPGGVSAGASNLVRVTVSVSELRP